MTVTSLGSSFCNSQVCPFSFAIFSRTFLWWNLWYFVHLLWLIQKYEIELSEKFRLDQAISVFFSPNIVKLVMHIPFSADSTQVSDYIGYHARILNRNL